MALWIESTASSHDEWSKQLVELLAGILVLKEEIWDELEAVSALDLANIEQPDNFRARTFWAAAVLEIRRQAKLKDLLEHLATRYPARKDDFARFLTLELSMVPQHTMAGAGWKAFDDPIDARFVGPGLASPVFDRENLRSDLRLLRSEGYRSLNIVGEPRSGKSFSLQLVQLLCEVDQTPLVIVDVEDWGTETFDDLALVDALTVQLGIDVDTDTVRNVPDPHTRARLLLYEFRASVEASGDASRWIVIDGLDRPSVHASAKAFVERLLKSIEKDNKPRNTRLVVTGFDGILPASSRRDETPDITAEDVDRLLTTVLAGRQPPVDEGVRAGWIATAMAAYEQAGRDLGALGSEIFRLVSEHLAAPAGVAAGADT